MTSRRGRTYALLVTSPAQRGLDRLPTAAATAVVEFMLGDMLVSPQRVGRPLRGELAGLWSARRGPYRVVYEIDESVRRIHVIRIDHRADVYRPG